MARKKSSKVKNAKLMKLWEQVFEIEQHLNEVTQQIATLVAENKVLHPESQLALHLIEVMDQWSSAVDEAVEAEEKQ